MTVAPSRSRVEHSKRTCTLGVTQDLSISSHETCANITCCRHKDEVRRIAVRLSWETGATDSNARSKLDHVHSRTTHGPLDPRKRLRNKSDPILFSQHRNFPHRDSRDEQAVVCTCISDRLHHGGGDLALLPLHCPDPYVGIEQERQAGCVICLHPTQHLWVRSGLHTRGRSHADSPRYHGAPYRQERASRPESHAW